MRGTGMGGDMVDPRRKRRVGVREEVGRARGRRGLPEEGSLQSQPATTTNVLLGHCLGSRQQAELKGV